MTIKKTIIECPDCGWICLTDTNNPDSGIFCQNPECMIDGKFKRIEPK